MKIIIEGNPNEIAALVLELQERQSEKFIPSDSDSKKVGLNQKCSC